MITGLAGPGAVAGGVWEVVANQARALLDAGHDVSVVAGWLGADPPAQLRGLAVDLVAVRPLVRPLGLRGVMGRGWNAAVQRALSGADVAHVHLCRDYLTMTATRIAQHLGVPIVAQPHGMLRRTSSPAFGLFDRLVTLPALGRADHFITLSDGEKPLLEGLGVPAAKMTTIENAVPDPLRSWQPGDGPMRLLFVSRLHPRKQVLVFADVVAQLRSAGLPVEGIVAGPDQGDLAGLRDFIRTARNGSAVRYVGEVDRAQLVTELARATALVFPARDEPFGLVLIEAMSVGTPIVCTDETPLAPLMRAASAGVTTRPDVASLLSATRRVVDDAALRSRLSHNGRLLYLAHWTNEAMVDRLVELYDRSRVPAGVR